ncbi:acyltransferase family protein [Paenibacillus wynnii]|uniref:Acyltransferase 3 domain-containing protein n=1 Tax=Paenibacillus wynnii TaxID=268407 RepID=A0A098M9Z4_9BACL|nr:acyltransferase [Paenibacillus wynnii]KGE19369.1 hypothetical protein PWYN_08475 [Paenibacillus wynnii]
MELSKKDTSILKGIAILCMVILHLFATKDITLYSPDYLINGVPATYYLGIMGDACPTIYLFVTGYEFYIMLNNSSDLSFGKNFKRVLKLYVNVWIVLAIFLPIGIATGTFSFDMARLGLNIIGLENTYNGAWWFVLVYILFVLLSPVLVEMVRKYPSVGLILISGLVYLLSHIQRYKPIIPALSNVLASDLMDLAVMLGVSLLSYITGAVFAKEKIFTKLHQVCSRIKFKNTLLVALGVGLVFFHAVVESSVIAPISGVVIICIYILKDKSRVVDKVLEFFSSHSTNIWLTHMFFYGTIFRDLTFAPRHPLLVFLWLITMCIITSYVIKLITKPIFTLIDRKQTVIKAQKVAV